MKNQVAISGASRIVGPSNRSLLPAKNIAPAPSATTTVKKTSAFQRVAPLARPAYQIAAMSSSQQSRTPQQQSRTVTPNKRPREQESNTPATVKRKRRVSPVKVDLTAATTTDSDDEDLSSSDEDPVIVFTESGRGHHKSATQSRAQAPQSTPSLTRGQVQLHSNTATAVSAAPVIVEVHSSSQASVQGSATPAEVSEATSSLITSAIATNQVFEASEKTLDIAAQAAKHLRDMPASAQKKNKRLQGDPHVITQNERDFARARFPSATLINQKLAQGSELITGENYQVDNVHYGRGDHHEIGNDDLHPFCVKCSEAYGIEHCALIKNNCIYCAEMTSRGLRQRRVRIRRMSTTMKTDKYAWHEHYDVLPAEVTNAITANAYVAKMTESSYEAWHARYGARHDTHNTRGSVSDLVIATFKRHRPKTLSDRQNQAARSIDWMLAGYDHMQLKYRRYLYDVTDVLFRHENGPSYHACSAERVEYLRRSLAKTLFHRRVSRAEITDTMSRMPQVETPALAEEDDTDPGLLGYQEPKVKGACDSDAEAYHGPIVDITPLRLSRKRSVLNDDGLVIEPPALHGLDTPDVRSPAVLEENCPAEIPVTTEADEDAELTSAPRTPRGDDASSDTDELESEARAVGKTRKRKRQSKKNKRGRDEKVTTGEKRRIRREKRRCEREASEREAAKTAASKHERAKPASKVEGASGSSLSSTALKDHKIKIIDITTAATVGDAEVHAITDAAPSQTTRVEVTPATTQTSKRKTVTQESTSAKKAKTAISPIKAPSDSQTQDKAISRSQHRSDHLISTAGNQPLVASLVDAKTIAALTVDTAKIVRAAQPVVIVKQLAIAQSAVTVSKTAIAETAAAVKIAPSAAAQPTPTVTVVAAPVATSSGGYPKVVHDLSGSTGEPRVAGDVKRHALAVLPTQPLVGRLPTAKQLFDVLQLNVKVPTGDDVIVLEEETEPLSKPPGGAPAKPLRPLPARPASTPPTRSTPARASTRVQQQKEREQQERLHADAEVARKLREAMAAHEQNEADEKAAAVHMAEVAAFAWPELLDATSSSREALQNVIEDAATQADVEHTLSGKATPLQPQVAQPPSPADLSIVVQEGPAFPRKITISHNGDAKNDVVVVIKETSGTPSMEDEDDNSDSASESGSSIGTVDVRDFKVQRSQHDRDSKSQRASSASGSDSSGSDSSSSSDAGSDSEDDSGDDAAETVDSPLVSPTCSDAEAGEQPGDKTPPPASPVAVTSPVASSPQARKSSDGADGDQSNKRSESPMETDQPSQQPPLPQQQPQPPPPLPQQPQGGAGDGPPSDGDGSGSSTPSDGGGGPPPPPPARIPETTDEADQRCRDQEFKHIREETLSENFKQMNVPPHLLRNCKPARQDGIAAGSEARAMPHVDKGAPLCKRIAAMVRGRQRKFILLLIKLFREGRTGIFPLPAPELYISNTYAYETEHAPMVIAAASFPKTPLGGMLILTDADPDAQLTVYDSDLRRIEKEAILGLHQHSVAQLLRDQLREQLSKPPDQRDEQILQAISRAMSQNGGNAVASTVTLHGHIHNLRTGALIDPQSADVDDIMAIMSATEPGASHLA